MHAGVSQARQAVTSYAEPAGPTIGPLKIAVTAINSTQGVSNV